MIKAGAKTPAANLVAVYDDFDYDASKRERGCIPPALPSSADVSIADLSIMLVLLKSSRSTPATLTHCCTYCSL